MREFEVINEGKKIRVRIVASTRAGLVGAALQGMFSAAGPKFSEAEEKSKTMERPFSVKAKGFNDLLVKLLAEALRQSAEYGEAYEEVRLSLILDNEAQGELIGRTVSGFTSPIKKAERLGLEVEKNDRGQWETIVVLAI